MMARIEKLTSLEELELHSVVKCPNFLTELRNLTEMRLLVIDFDEMGEGVSEALVGSLCNLRRIQNLTVTRNREIYYDDGAWEDWTPPSEIRDLSLVNICLPKCPSWIGSSNFAYLSSLQLHVVEVN
jgi:hypothetical protein